MSVNLFPTVNKYMRQKALSRYCVLITQYTVMDSLFVLVLLITFFNDAAKAVWSRFFPLYLLHIGFSASQIGNAKSLSLILKFLVQICLAFMEDTGILSKLATSYVVVIMFNLLSVVLIWMMQVVTPVQFVLLCTLKCILSILSASSTLTEGILAKKTKSFSMPYTTTQMMHTIAWCGAVFSFGYFIRVYTYSSMFVFVIFSKLMVIVGVFILSKTSVCSNKTQPLDLGIWKLIDSKSRSFIVMSMAWGCCFIAVESITAMQMKTEFGFSTFDIGICSIVSAFFGALPSYIVLQYVMKRYGHAGSICIAIDITILFLILHCFANKNKFAFLVLISPLRGISFAIIQGAVMDHILINVDSQVITSATALFTVNWFTNGGAVGNFVWSHLYEIYGAQCVYMVCTIFLLLSKFEFWRNRSVTLPWILVPLLTFLTYFSVKHSYKHSQQLFRYANQLSLPTSSKSSTITLLQPTKNQYNMGKNASILLTTPTQPFPLPISPKSSTSTLLQPKKNQYGMGKNASILPTTLTQPFPLPRSPKSSTSTPLQPAKLQYNSGKNSSTLATKSNRISLGEPQSIEKRRHIHSLSEYVTYRINNQDPKSYSYFADRRWLNTWVKAQKCGAKMPAMISWYDASNITQLKSFIAPKNGVVVKTNHMCGNMVKLRPGEALSNKQVKMFMDNMHKSYRDGAEKHYVFAQRGVMIEEFLSGLGSSLNSPPDYKMYAFDGEIKLVAVFFGRENKHQTEVLFVDPIHFTPLNFRHAHFPPVRKKISMPCGWKDTIQTARCLSRGINYARIDMYIINCKPFLSEVTMTPVGGGEIDNAGRWLSQFLSSWNIYPRGIQEALY